MVDEVDEGAFDVEVDEGAFDVADTGAVRNGAISVDTAGVFVSSNSGQLKWMTHIYRMTFPTYQYPNRQL